MNIPHKNIPNILCFLRIIGALLLLCELKQEHYISCLWIVVASGITDFLDGYLARRWKVESRFGALLDPLADKIFINTTLWGIFYYMGFKQIFPIAIMLTFRDVILIIGSIYVLLSKKQIKVDLSPNMISKACTALLFSLIVLILYTKSETFLITSLSYSLTILIIITFIIYLKRALLTIRKL